MEPQMEPKGMKKKNKFGTLSQGPVHGCQMEAKGGHGEAKGKPMEPKRVPKGCEGEAKKGQGGEKEAQGGQGEAKERPREAKPRQKAQPSQKIQFFGACFDSLFGSSDGSKSSKNRESDFLKMSVSPGRRVFVTDETAKPSLVKPGLGSQGSQRREKETPGGCQGEVSRGQEAGQGRPRGGQERTGEAKGSQARPECSANQKTQFFGLSFDSLFGAPAGPKSSPNRESDFLKMNVSPGHGAHFHR